ncbi:hypothetical protein [Salinicola endophyticus]|uniref:Transcriptional regulator n=1 Tax=Salinicola endophyticus TaxID=1949083 RepID=A0AB74U7Q5_9GAMM
MICITLDMQCSLCGSDRFHLPTQPGESPHVRCANCTAVKCQTLALESTLMASRREQTPPRHRAA